MAASVANAFAFNPIGTKMLIVNCLIALPIKGSPVFSKCAKSLPINSYDCTILWNWVFDNFILAEELFAKALESFETYVLVNNNLGRKLFSSSPTASDESFKITSVPFFVPDFNILSCRLENFTFNVIYWVILC